LTSLLPNPNKLRAASSRNGPDAPAGFALRRYSSFAEAAVVRREWDELALRVGGDVFNTFDWCETWWRHFGHGRRAMIAAAFHSESLVAVWPLFRETIRWGPAWLRVVRIMGSDHGVTPCHVLTEPEWIDAAGPAMVEAIEADGPWDMLYFGELPGYETRAASLGAALRRSPHVGEVVVDEDAYPQAVFDVPPDHETYLAGLSLKERRNVRRDERELQKSAATTSSPRTAQELQRAFDALIELHGRQWRTRGRLGHFQDIPGIELFHREVAEKCRGQDRLAMVEVRSGGNALASEYALRFNDRVHWIIGGRREEVTSRVGFGALMRSAMAEGVGLIDGLPGAYDYKRRLGARSVSVKTIQVFPARRRGSMRRAATRAAVRGASVLYHRAWFWHLEPWCRLRMPHLSSRVIPPGLWERFGRSRFLVVGNGDDREAEAKDSAPSVGRAGDPATESGLQHRVLNSFDEAEGLREEWDGFVAGCDGDLYSTFDWCRIWWRHYGDGRALEVHLFRDKGALVAILPTLRETVRFGPIAVRAIRLVGCDHSTTTCGPVIHPDRIAETVGRYAQWLELDAGWDVLHWGPLAGYFAHRPEMAAAFSKTLAWETQSCAEGEPHIVWDLPVSFEQYLAGLQKKERSNIRICRKKLAEGAEVSDAAGGNAELERSFATFIDQHQRQWQAEGKLGHFADWPGAGAFHVELARTMQARGRLWLLRLDSEGRTMGFQYNYRFGKRIHWLLGSRETDPRWDSYSSGRLLHAHTIERAIEEGCAQIDGLRGMYEYKLRLGGKVTRLQSITLIRQGAWTRARVAGVRWAGRALDLVYYRLWFGRVAPALPLRRRGLWKRWIRSRF
jgi:CelD/BcsL family acetyltransferase involved in cellulose biosynthesis